MTCLIHKTCSCSPNWEQAQLDADEVLKSILRVDIAKALDPLDDDDFLIIAHTIAAELSDETAALDAAAYRAAVARLDLDWHNLTDVEMAAALAAVNAGLALLPAQIIPRIVPLLDDRLIRLIESVTGRAMERYGIQVGTALTVQDTEMVAAIARIGGWVTNEYGNRQSMFTTGVEKIVRRGLEAGIRNEDIAKNIADAADMHGVRKPLNYWRLLAMSTANTARSYSHLKSMQSGGIQNYVFQAVLDERTTEICNSLHGTVFPVSVAMQNYGDLAIRSAFDMNAVEKIMPHVKQRKRADGTLEMYTEPPGSGRNVLATVEPNGVRTIVSPTELISAGVVVPPIHHACRSSIIADV